MNANISIVTIVRNDLAGVKKTIKSVLNQTSTPFEFILINGDSVDGTTEYLESNKNFFSHLISEKDDGIYDAMNKGIKNSRGEWLIFMNSGDEFYCPSTLERLKREIEANQSFDILYSNTEVAWKDCPRIAYADHKNRKFIHQSICYKKKLHQIYGEYLCIPGFSIADYLFFSLLSQKNNWKKVDFIISRCDPYGLSSKERNYRLVMQVNIMFGFEKTWLCIVKIVLHPIYYALKRGFLSRYIE